MKQTNTYKQQMALNYLRQFFEENDQLPPATRIRDYFGWASENSTVQVMRSLTKQGFIKKNSVGKYMFTREATE